MCACDALKNQTSRPLTKRLPGNKPLLIARLITNRYYTHFRAFNVSCTMSLCHFANLHFSLMLEGRKLHVRHIVGGLQGFLFICVNPIHPAADQGAPPVPLRTVPCPSPQIKRLRVHTLKARSWSAFPQSWELKRGAQFPVFLTLRVRQKNVKTYPRHLGRYAKFNISFLENVSGSCYLLSR